MSDPMHPSDPRHLIAAYALDALDADEREAVERLMAADPTAAAELDSMRETAALLASAEHGGERAPVGIWERIASEVSEPAPVIPVPIGVVREREARAAPRATQRYVSLRVAASLAAAASIAIALLAVGLVDARSDLSAERATAGMREVFARASDLPEARPAVLRHDSTEVASLVVMPDGTGLILNEGLDPLPEGRTYQLWAVLGDPDDPTVISAGVLGPDPDVTAFTFSGEVVAFVLTVEDGAGVVSSAEPAFAMAEMPPA